MTFCTRVVGLLQLHLHCQSVAGLPGSDAAADGSAFETCTRSAKILTMYSTQMCILVIDIFKFDVRNIKSHCSAVITARWMQFMHGHN